MNLVLIETSGNQSFIFATNKLRENVGASELIYRTGTKYVFDAVKNLKVKVPGDPRIPSEYPPLSTQNPVEIILAASGKALLLVQNADVGRRIVREVTSRALEEAPGVDVYGVVSRDFDFDDEPIHPLVGEVHRQYERVRSRLPGAVARFQRLPIVAECATSGLPAARLACANDEVPVWEHREYSASVFAKVRARKGWEDRLKKVLHRQNVNHCLPDTLTGLEELGCDWLAIIHADGNGLGQVFLNFDKLAKVTDNRDNRDYITKLREFSLALDECTERAFCQALRLLYPRGGFLPIVPLVLGGDDLTVICDGRQALRFAKEFLDNFEKATREHKAIQPILNNGVTSCAGVAIVKPHFPFFAAYQLAEELLQSAKKIAKQNPQSPVSAVDYHILHDASGPNLERIRRELTVDDGNTLLVGRPYVTTANQGPVHRHWEKLKERVKAVRAVDGDGRRQLPNSMLHALRQSLFLGQQVADAQLKLVLERYRKQGLATLLGDGDSLFWMDTDCRRTGLLDAVDTAEFLED